MKNLVRFTLCSLLISLLISCEKVIEVDLEDAATQMVFEANLKEGNQVFEVKLSMSQPYFGEAEVDWINDATVSLRNGAEEEWFLLFQGDGLYTAEVDAAVNELYTLNIELDGVSYRASSYLNEPISLTEVYSEFQEAQGLFEEGYTVYFRYLDPQDQTNYYRVVHTVNGEPQTEGNDLQLLDDVLNNGAEARIPIFRKLFDSGDEVEIELRHIDENAYHYFNSLSEIIGSGQGPGGSAAPGNPINNWSSSNVLGHFTAYSNSESSITLP